MWDSRLLNAAASDLSNEVDKGDTKVRNGTDKKKSSGEKGNELEEDEEEEDGKKKEDQKDKDQDEDSNTDGEFTSGELTSDEDGVTSDEGGSDDEFGNRITKSKLAALRRLPGNHLVLPANVGKLDDADDLLNHQVPVVPSINLPVFLAGAVKPVVVQPQSDSLNTIDASHRSPLPSGSLSGQQLIDTFGSRPINPKFRRVKKPFGSRPTNVGVQQESSGGVDINTFGGSSSGTSSSFSSSSQHDVQVVDSFGSQSGSNPSQFDFGTAAGGSSFGSRSENKVPSDNDVLPSLQQARDTIFNAVHWNQNGFL